MAYGWAVAFGTTHAILMALAAWLFAIVAAIVGDRAPWMGVAAFVMFLSALMFFLGVMTARIRLVVPAFALGAIAAVPALRYALVDVSDHGDGKLVALAVGVGLTGLVAVLLTSKAAHEPADRQL